MTDQHYAPAEWGSEQKAAMGMKWSMTQGVHDAAEGREGGVEGQVAGYTFFTEDITIYIRDDRSFKVCQ